VALTTQIRDKTYMGEVDNTEYGYVANSGAKRKKSRMTRDCRSPTGESLEERGRRERRNTVVRNRIPIQKQGRFVRDTSESVCEIVLRTQS